MLHGRPYLLQRKSPRRRVLLGERVNDKRLVPTGTLLSCVLDDLMGETAVRKTQAGECAREFVRLVQRIWQRVKYAPKELRR